jgi:O-antigen/teichoic acid export membrane protein
MLGCFLSFAFIVAAPEALMILSISNDSYWIAKFVVPPIVLGTLAQYFYTNYVNVEIFCKKTPIIAIGSCAAAGLNYILNAALIPRFGYIAAAYTTLASYLVLMIMHFIMVRFVLREKVYDDIFMFASMIVMMGVGYLFGNMYGDGVRAALIRYALALAITAVFAIILRRDIITLIDYVKKRFFGKRS